MTTMVGQTIAHYQVEALVGDGGMGTVYKAVDLNLERTVALKLMHPHFARREEFRQRLTQEAKSAAQLDHPSIVKIFDFGQDGDDLYIAMEYISGGNLRAHLRRLKELGQYLPYRQCLQIGIQIAEALDYAHERGMIHRDVKSSNIILKKLSRPDNPGELPFRAVLTDFGLVKLIAGEDLTETGVTFGTPAYMSPEQCAGQELDARSDIYSLGVVLYELVANRPPFDFVSLTEATAIHQRGDQPPPVTDHRAGTPGIISSVISQALAKDPDDRFQNGSEFAETLRGAKYALDEEPTQIVVKDEGISTSPEHASAAAMSARVRIETPGHEPRVANLKRAEVTIGRNADNDIVLPSEGVSRYHARLRKENGEWYVQDLGGANGTWMAGRRLEPAKNESLSDGTVLEIGPYRLVLDFQKREAEPEVPFGVPVSIATRSESAKVAAEDEKTSEKVSEDKAPLEIFITRELAKIDPGERMITRVEVVNHGEIDDRIMLQVDGLPSGWVTLPDAFVDVPAGSATTIPVIFHPPRRSDSAAGRQRFRVEVVSQRHKGREPSANASLLVGTFEAFEMALQPDELRLPGTVRVALKNTGNRAAEFRIMGRDPNGTLRFQGDRRAVRLESGQSATVDLRVESRRQRLIGATEFFPFEIETSSESGLRHSISGRARSSGVISAGIAYAGLFVVIFLCALAALFMVFGRGDLLGLGANRSPEARASLTAEAIGGSATAEPGATSAAATNAAATAQALGDADKDGLSDSQELIIGTDPQNPDSDGDGLLDGEEVLTWATSPQNRDTDGDILLDGDEVRIYGTSPSKADTDGDTINDGTEIAEGTDPLDPNDPSPEATPTPTGATETPTASTATATPTPSASPTETPTLTPSHTATSTPTPSATSTATPSPSPTPTNTPDVTATIIPPLAISCAQTTPLIDGTVQGSEWQGSLVASFEPENDVDRQVQVYFMRSSTNAFLAFVINDPTENLTTDSLKVYFDANNNGGDPDDQDRFFQVSRDGTLAVRAGEGSNDDGDFWDGNYNSQAWNAEAGEITNSRWAVEINIDLIQEMPAIAGEDDFTTMVLVQYTGIQFAWPSGSETNNSEKWQQFLNTDCS